MEFKKIMIAKKYELEGGSAAGGLGYRDKGVLDV